MEYFYDTKCDINQWEERENTLTFNKPKYTTYKTNWKNMKRAKIGRVSVASMLDLV